MKRAKVLISSNTAFQMGSLPMHLAMRIALVVKDLSRDIWAEKFITLWGWLIMVQGIPDARP